MLGNLSLLVAILTTALATEIQNCGDTAVPQEVRIEACDIPPCQLQKGKNASVEFDFAASSSVTSFSPQVYALYGGTQIPFIGVEPDGCKSLISGECPLESGEEVTYKASLLVRPFYPTINLTVEWSLLDQDEGAIVCFQVDIQVVG